MELKLEQKAHIKFCILLRKSGTETFQMIQQAYGNYIKSLPVYFEWHSRFRSGKMAMKDEERSDLSRAQARKLWTELGNLCDCPEQTSFVGPPIVVPCCSISGNHGGDVGMSVDDDVTVCREVTDADIVAKVIINNIQAEDGASGDEEDNSSVVRKRPIPSVEEAMDHIQEFRIYSAGLLPKVSNLYPPVQYPVSRGTASLSSLVTWDHHDNWKTALDVDTRKLVWDEIPSVTLVRSWKMLLDYKASENWEEVEEKCNVENATDNTEIILLLENFLDLRKFRCKTLQNGWESPGAKSTSPVLPPGGGIRKPSPDIGCFLRRSKRWTMNYYKQLHCDDRHPISDQEDL
uniref:Mos1 transposase HTH domain-containing protein n=1 Tax=Timema poppense TaxID=170557 RepID=A0A7R9D6U5_TIMPO|nr:unnamed protein product [Timema poppensis]